MKKTFYCFIPARLKSSRFPNKLTYNLLGLNILQHTLERIILSKNLNKLILVSGDLKLINQKFSTKIEKIKTLKKHQNGTSRISEVSKKYKFDYCIIVQADEPLIIPKFIDDFVSKINKIKFDKNKIYNFVTNLNASDLKDKSIVKVFTSVKSEQIMFYQRHVDIDLEPLINKNIFQSLGVYCIPKNILDNFTKLKPGILEKTCKIEQFRYLENEIKIVAHFVKKDFGSVNYSKDIIATKKKLITDKLQKKIFKKYFDKYRYNS